MPTSIERSDDTDLEATLDSFMLKLGQRVLQWRQRSGLSRRELAESSGVSQRTIVLLETGAGNISIALLYRIAHALESDVASLLATPAETATVHRRFCLIGLRGAGKSTLGAGLAQELGLPFIEVSQRIELISGLKVEEVVDLYGQEGFRKLEREAIEQIAQTGDDVVIAVGGGVVSDAETYAFVIEQFHTVWLKATPQEHMDRVRAQGDERPMAGNPEAMQSLKNILTQREALYADAHATVDTSGEAISASLKKLLHAAHALQR